MLECLEIQPGMMPVIPIRQMPVKDKVTKLVLTRGRTFRDNHRHQIIKSRDEMSLTKIYQIKLKISKTSGFLEDRIKRAATGDPAKCQRIKTRESWNKI